MSATYAALRTIAERNRSETDQTFESGAALICPTTWIAPHSWLHRLMPPCAEDAIAQLAPTTGRQPPRVFAEFLRSANGASLFNGSLNVYGVRGDFSRNPETALLLPYDVAVETLSIDSVVGADDFLCGSIGPEVEPCVWRASSERIERLDRQTGEVLESWPSFHEWLVQEAERYSTLYSAEGRLIAPVNVAPGKAEPWPQEALGETKTTRWSPA